MDLFIPLHLKDIDILPYSIESVRQFVEPRATRITVVATELPHGIREQIASYGVNFMDESDVIADLPRSAMPRVVASDNMDRTGWYFQQFLKWGFRRHTAGRFYAVVDADTTFTAHARLIENNKYILQQSGSQHHTPYFQTYQKLLGYPATSRTSFIAEHMIFDVPALDQLIADIEKRAGIPWHQAILRAIDPKEISGFSEYETYGNFLTRNNPDSFTTTPQKNVGLPRERLAAHPRNAEQFLAQGFTAITYYSFSLPEVHLLFGGMQQFLDLSRELVIVDAGSHDAAFAILAKRMLPRTNVFVIDGDPLAIEMCRRQLVDRTDINVIPRPLGDGAANSIPLAQWMQQNALPKIDVLYLNLNQAFPATLRGLGPAIHNINLLILARSTAAQSDPAFSQPAVSAMLAPLGFRLAQPREPSDRIDKDLYIRQPSPQPPAPPRAPTAPAQNINILGRTPAGGSVISFGKPREQTP